MFDYYTIEKDNEILTDIFGNNFIFKTYEEANNFIEEHEIDNAKITKQK